MNFLSGERGGLKEQEPGKGIPLAFGILFYSVVGLVGLGLPRLLGRWEGVARLAEGRVPWIQEAAMGLVLGALLVTASRVLVARWKLMADLEKALARLVGPMGSGEALVLAVVSGLAEEMLFRCALLDLLGPWWSTLVFAFCHTGPGKEFRAWTLMAGLVGGLFAWLVLQGWGLTAVALAHITLNYLNLKKLAHPPTSCRE